MRPLSQYWLLLILVIVLGLHLAFIGATPGKTRLKDDETGYLYRAVLDLDENERGLLPGQFRPGLSQPQLISRVLSYFIPREAFDVRFPINAFRYFQIALLGGLLCTVYYLGILLGTSRTASALSALMVGLLPFFAFYVHTLWGDFIYGFLQMAILAATVLYGKTLRYRWLPVIAFFFVYAMMCRNAFGQFSIVILAYVFYSSYTGCEKDLRWQRLGEAAARTLLLGVLMFVPLIPQVLAYEKAGYGLRLSANTWQNIEYSVRRPTPFDPAWLSNYNYAALAETQERHPFFVAWDEYYAAGSLPQERESAAKIRFVEFCKLLPVHQILFRQLYKNFYEVPLKVSAEYEQATWRNRWAPSILDTMKKTMPLAKWTWRLFMVAGFFAFLFVLLKRPDKHWWIPLLFTGYYCSGVLLAGYVVRYFMPLVPLFGLFLGHVMDYVPLRKMDAPKMGRASHALIGLALFLIVLTIVRGAIP